MLLNDLPYFFMIKETENRRDKINQVIEHIGLTYWGGKLDIKEILAVYGIDSLTKDEKHKINQEVYDRYGVLLCL